MSVPPMSVPPVSCIVPPVSVLQGYCACVLQGYSPDPRADNYHPYATMYASAPLVKWFAKPAMKVSEYCVAINVTNHAKQ